jgi:hypothetical protein
MTSLLLDNETRLKTFSHTLFDKADCVLNNRSLPQELKIRLLVVELIHSFELKSFAGQVLEMWVKEDAGEKPVFVYAVPNGYTEVPGVSSLEEDNPERTLTLESAEKTALSQLAQAILTHFEDFIDFRFRSVPAHLVEPHSPRDIG